MKNTKSSEVNLIKVLGSSLMKAEHVCPWLNLAFPVRLEHSFFRYSTLGLAPGLSCKLDLSDKVYLENALAYFVFPTKAKQKFNL